MTQTDDNLVAALMALTPDQRAELNRLVHDFLVRCGRQDVIAMAERPVSRRH